MRAIWLASLCLVATTAHARPYTIDDMLKLESYGSLVIDPSERWAVVERRRPFDQAPRYDLESRTELALSRIYVLDLSQPNQLRLAFPQEDDAGYWSAGFSPSGQRLAVFRIQGDKISLGIVDMLTSEVRWLGPAADVLEASPRPVWLDDDNLMFATRTRGDLPYRFSSGAHRRVVADRLSRTAEGRTPSVRVSGSGVYDDLNVSQNVSAIVRVSLSRGTIEEVERGAISDFAVSSDRRKVAIVLRGPPIQPYLDRAVDPAFQTRRQRLVVEDVATGAQVEPCPSCDILPNLLAWGPQGANLLFFARHDEEPWEQGQLYRFAGETPARPVLPANLRADLSTLRGSAPTVNAAWAGSTPLVLARSQAGTVSWYRLENSGPVALPLTRADRLLYASAEAVVALSGGEVRLVRRDDRSVTLVHDVLEVLRGAEGEYIHSGIRLFFNPDLNRLPPLRVDGATAQRVISLDPETARERWSIAVPEGAALLAAAPGQGNLLYFRRAVSGVGTFAIAAQDPGTSRDLEVINSHLADVEVPQRRPLRARTADGRELTHWLTLPSGNDRAPLVVIPYPGLDRGNGSPPPLDHSAWQSYTNVALLVAAGYAVLQPSLPTSSAVNRERTSLGEQGTLTEAARVPDDFDGDRYLDELTEGVLNAVDAAIGTGRVDPDRLALYGNSYGGFGVVGIATRTDRFDAVIASAGVYNLLAAYGSMSVHDIPEIGIPTGMFSWFEAGQGGLGAPPWRQLQGYAVRSPFFSIDRLRTPTLLIHGENDFLPVGNAEQMFMGLHRLGRDALLLRYAGEGHAITSPANTRHAWEQILAFLEVHLGRADQSRQ